MPCSQFLFFFFISALVFITSSCLSPHSLLPNKPCVIPILLLPFPGLVFPIPLHMQSQLQLMLRFPRYSCPCKDPFPQKRELQLPWNYLVYTGFEFAYLICFLRHSSLLVSWFICCTPGKLKHCLLPYTNCVKVHLVTCFSHSVFFLTALTALPLLLSHKSLACTCSWDTVARPAEAPSQHHPDPVQPGALWWCLGWCL